MVQGTGRIGNKGARTKEEAERRKAVLPELVARYMAGGPENTIELLSTEFNIPEKTLYYNFKKMGVSRKDDTEKRTSMLKEVSQAVQLNISTQAQKLAQISVGLGGRIANKYLPLIDAMMDDGLTLEQIADAFADWYEAKPTTDQRISDLESQITQMEEHIGTLEALTEPNYRYKLRVGILDKYAKDIMRGKAYGIKINLRQTLEAMNTDLMNLERGLD
jgi:DNA-binding transcriptional MerR regulator